MCKNGCGHEAFSTYDTCCTHCIGAQGPHAKDCVGKGCLLDTGVLKEDLAKDFLSSANLDRSELSRFARRVGKYQGIPDFSELLDKASNIFDFSETKRSESASVGRVFLVGDALLEPFWPEGLGIVRE